MRTKVIALMAIIVLFIIFVTQNNETITVKVFFWQFEMSLIVLITLNCLVGVVAGFIMIKVFSVSGKRKDRNDVPGDSNPN
jgi:uncharacterized integral membrane protein